MFLPGASWPKREEIASFNSFLLVTSTGSYLASEILVSYIKTWISGLKALSPSELVKWLKLSCVRSRWPSGVVPMNLVELTVRRGTTDATKENRNTHGPMWESSKGRLYVKIERSGMKYSRYSRVSARR
jgi:hypothetical protein